MAEQGIKPRTLLEVEAPPVSYPGFILVVPMIHVYTVYRVNLFLSLVFFIFWVFFALLQLQTVSPHLKFAQTHLEI